MRALLGLLAVVAVMSVPAWAGPAWAGPAEAGPAWAVEPDEMLDDPVLESRARDISKQLRCVVCQNQTIDNSNAEIARDMRLFVRERLVAGDSDEQAIGYLVERYGDYVLLDPPFKFSTLPLWLGPPFLVLAIGLVLLMNIRRYQHRRMAAGDEVTPLSASEMARLDALVDEMPAGKAAGDAEDDDAGGGQPGPNPG